MSIRITKEQWDKVSEEHKDAPTMTEEEKARMAAFARKMKSLSREDWEALRKRMIEEEPFD